MSDKFKVLQGILASNVANGGTFAVSYPQGTNAATFQNGYSHKLVLGQNNTLVAPQGLTVSFGSSTITITNASGSTWSAGTAYALELDILGEFNKTDTVYNSLDAVTPAIVEVINLGNPVAGASTAVSASQSLTAASLVGALLNGSTAGVLDVPRNIVAAWTNSAVITVTGTDAYGKVIVESSTSGTSFTGKKAFKTVTKVTVSADVTGLTVGTGNVLGLPLFLPATAFVLREIEDNATATAGTLVAGANLKATATTGDVRGTYTPNSTPDGSKVFRLVAALTDPKYLGATQFAG